MANFITATQEWVKNRINEARNYTDTVKSGIMEAITDLVRKLDNHFKRIEEKLAEQADEIVTGHLEVQGSTGLGGPVDVHGPVTAAGVATTAPVVIMDQEGLIIQTVKGKTGLSEHTLSIMNDRGKVSHLFMKGDRLFYDYPYDKIYTCFDKSIGSFLQYLHRGSTPLDQVVGDIEQFPTDGERLSRLENWFNRPDDMAGHPETRLFGTPVNECFPANGAPFMIPESIYFRCPETYKIDSLKLLDKDGQAIQILKSFQGYNIKKLLINFPFVRKISDPDPAIPEVPQGVAPRTIEQTYSAQPVTIKHVADFEGGYYEVTDPDARFAESIETGLVPNVILRVSDFPKDQVSVLHFSVIRA